MRLPVVLLACLASLTACQGPSQLVVGVATNLKVRDELTRVSLEALRNGIQVGQEFWDISNQTNLEFLLPGSYNYYSEEGGTPVIELQLKAYYGEDLTPKVERITQLQLIAGETMFHRMTLVRACRVSEPGADCEEGFHCVEGLCKPDPIDSRSLLPYTGGREALMECDSGQAYIDTGTCGSGTCALTPIAAASCPAGQFCSEGTCYQYNPANPRQLEIGEVCSAPDGDRCRLADAACGGIAGDKTRCRQTCTTAADCTKQLPQSSAAEIPATVADCIPASAGPKVCTFACDPVAAVGCPDGIRCQVVNDGQQLIAPDCVTATSVGGTVAIGGACDASHGSDDCVPGATCILTTGNSTTTCSKTCLIDAPASCPSDQTCTPIQTTTGFSSPRYGVCN